MSQHPINLVINGRKHNATVEGRLTLSDFLRGDAGCTGVHVGYEHGVCGACTVIVDGNDRARSEEHTSELQSLMRISYAVFCLKKKIEIVYYKHSFSINKKT